jgi:quercetin dioxygenase-like cupin family protein
MEPYALNDGEGRSYLWHNFLFTMKAGVRETGGAFAFMDFATRRGEEPPEHVRGGEDELFYILDGDLTFSCGDKSFNVGPRGFCFLPRDIPHSFTIHSDSEGLARMLVITYPDRFGQTIEATGQVLPAPRGTAAPFEPTNCIMMH